MHFK